MALGERVRNLRARRGLTRRAVALAAEVSERHLANLEYGIGNASFLVLQQVAAALQCPLAELTGDVTTSSPEWLLIRELLEQRDEATLRRARIAIGQLLGTGGASAARNPRIALIGLRGAGKSAREDARRRPGRALRRIEPRDREVRRLQHRRDPGAVRHERVPALRASGAGEAIQIYPRPVLATPGGVVSDAATFNQLLAHCTTVWLYADAEDHMKRVAAQGDLRPMAASREAMDDLRQILAGGRRSKGRPEARHQRAAAGSDLQQLHGSFWRRAPASAVKRNAQNAYSALDTLACVHYDACHRAISKATNARRLNLRVPMSQAPASSTGRIPRSTSTGS